MNALLNALNKYKLENYSIGFFYGEISLSWTIKNSVHYFISKDVKLLIEKIEGTLPSKEGVRDEDLI
jgi:hypothetical protein